MIELPTEVIGFHGTRRDVVSRLLAHDIQVSGQHFEWLGTGFYFWQDSPWRAQRWAAERFGDDATVVAARVSLDGCLNLLNPRWHAALSEADDRYVNDCFNQGRAPAENRPSGNRARDCAVINWYCERAAQENLHVRSVRAIFEEGEPIFEASAIRALLSHVQIAVRHPSVIFEIEEPLRAIAHQALRDPDVDLTQQLIGASRGLLVDLGFQACPIGAVTSGMLPPTVLVWIAGDDTTPDEREQLAVLGVPGLWIGRCADTVEGWAHLDPDLFGDRAAFVQSTSGGSQRSDARSPLGRRAARWSPRGRSVTPTRRLVRSIGGRECAHAHGPCLERRARRRI